MTVSELIGLVRELDPNWFILTFQGGYAPTFLVYTVVACGLSFIAGKVFGSAARKEKKPRRSRVAGWFAERRAKKDAERADREEAVRQEREYADRFRRAPYGDKVVLCALFLEEEGVSFPRNYLGMPEPHGTTATLVDVETVGYGKYVCRLNGNGRALFRDYPDLLSDALKDDARKALDAESGDCIPVVAPYPADGSW